MKSVILLFLVCWMVVPAFSQPPLPIIGYLKGDNQNDRLGTTLAGPGDVNNDGYADLLAAELGTKRVKLFYGNFGRIDSIPDMTWNGYISVRTIGDINGDGKPEVVLATDTINQLQIFWGGNLLDTLPDFVLTFSPDTACSGGVALQDASAGDLNGDGCGDLVVSTIYSCSGPPSSLGRVQIFWGGSILDTFPDWTRTVSFQLSPYRTRFGAAVKVLPNLDGDSFADLVVARMGNDAGVTTPGCLHIFLGGNPMDTLEDQILNAPAPAEGGDTRGQWGEKIILLNDLNGDGRTDFWVGGPSTRLRRYNGWFPIDSVPSAVLDQGGNQPAPGGDYNQDGFTDLILGQPRASFLAGSVFIYLGSSNMNGNFDIAIHDFQLPTVAQVFGLAVTNTGDMDGDGIDDFAASAKFDTDPFDRGEAFIFSGDSSIPTGVKDDKTNLPYFFELFQNNPNPFQQSTEVGFNLKPTVRPETVRLEVYNLLGQKIRTLIDQRGKAGEHKVFWDGRDITGKAMPSGIYFYKLSYANETQVKKMLLVR
ncbi:MAG: FG-GAP-like repeat-containing protein [candidate division Zixibacteria bacterium]|nr:FG-GAP-like repeat-containing protein [candidate division Zixibacteria bacterium]